MQVSQLADKLNTSSDTIRRWTKQYEPYLSPTATITQRGGAQNTPRTYTEQDAAVLMFVAEMREVGKSHEQINIRLTEYQAQNYETLPAVPNDWFNPVQAIPVNEAQRVATQTAQAIVLRAEYERAIEDRDIAQARVDELEARLEEARTSKQQDQERIHQLELELAEARAAVAAYTVQGRVLSPFILIAAVALAVVVTTILVIVVGRLL
jgi:DNA-binding transcriptional MerR regulator